VVSYAQTAIYENVAACPQEELWVLILNARYFLTHEVLVSRGTLDQSLASPGIVFRDAIRLNAARIILLHNHPSGDPEPSHADIILTRRMCEAGDLLGTPVADHLILAGTTSLSMLEHGFIT
jgi:DNA repair protein RadC